MATWETVKPLSLGSKEDLENCYPRPSASDNSFLDLLHYLGTLIWRAAMKTCIIKTLFDVNAISAL